jgi:hypothetical protein
MRIATTYRMTIPLAWRDWQRTQGVPNTACLLPLDFHMMVSLDALDHGSSQNVSPHPAMYARSHNPNHQHANRRSHLPRRQNITDQYEHDSAKDVRQLPRRPTPMGWFIVGVLRSPLGSVPPIQCNRYNEGNGGEEEPNIARSRVHVLTPLIFFVRLRTRVLE